MPLHRLQVYQFRNLQDICINLDAGLQIIFGDNASGKTSLLDAIHVLCSGKSFLGALPKKLQRFSTEEFSICGDISQPPGSRIPIQYRWQNSHIQLIVSCRAVRRTSEYAAYQPIQAITPLSYRLLDDSPIVRRQFMDWGVFHVKHDYAEIWRRFQRSLSQRNAMLSSGADLRMLSIWNQEFIQLSQSMDRYRAEYLDILRPKLMYFFSAFLPEVQLDIHYQRGWAADKGLQDVLEENLPKDMERRFTYYGPQRADINIRLNGISTKDFASRGQKKLITFALYLAQVSLQQKLGRHSAILLIDDLPSELDQEHVSLVISLLKTIPMQIFISCIDLEQLPGKHRMANKMFHVKQGKVKEVLQ